MSEGYEVSYEALGQGWMSTGAAYDRSEKHWYVRSPGAAYGPYESEADASAARARMIVQDKAQNDHKSATLARAEKAKKKLTQEEYDAIRELGFNAGRGYW